MDGDIRGCWMEIFLWVSERGWMKRSVNLSYYVGRSKENLHSCLWWGHIYCTMLCFSYDKGAEEFRSVGCKAVQPLQPVGGRHFSWNMNSGTYTNRNKHIAVNKVCSGWIDFIRTKMAIKSTLSMNFSYFNVLQWNVAG